MRRIIEIGGEPHFLEKLRKLEILLKGDHPEDLKLDYISEITSDRRMLKGTTAPIIEPQLVRSRGGILIPAGTIQDPTPFDIFAVYLTFERLSGQKISLSTLLTILSAFPRMAILDFVSFWLGKYHVPGLSSDEVDTQYLEQFFGDMGSKIANLSKYERLRLVTPQALLVLAKLTFFVCTETGIPKSEHLNVPIPFLPFMVADQLSVSDGVDSRQEADIERLTPEVASNQYFNAPRDPAHFIGRWVRQWRELPHEDRSQFRVENWDELFLEATGTTFEDLAKVALALWSAACSAHTRVNFGYFEKLGLSNEKVTAVMRLIGATPDRMLEELQKRHEKTDLPGLRWDFSAFSRFPVICLDDGYLVLDPSLLLQRAFGWTLFLDVTDYLEKRKDRRKDAFKRAARHYAECYALEVVDSIVEVGNNGISFRENEIKNAYPGSGIPVADTALSNGDSWIVLEVTSRQLMRDTVAGISNESLAKDIRMFTVEKGKQIASTISKLRQDESRLTGIGGKKSRRFLPVIVATEGFPVNPLTCQIIREQLKNGEILQEDDVFPLQIMDISELEMVESLQEIGGMNFADLLTEKAGVTFANSSVRDFLIRGPFPAIVRSARIDKLWPTPFNEMILLLDGEEDDGQS